MWQDCIRVVIVYSGAGSRDTEHKFIDDAAKTSYNTYRVKTRRSRIDFLTTRTCIYMHLPSGFLPLHYIF